MCEQCRTNKKDIYIGQKIKIGRCTAVGEIFENCTEDSIHEIVEPPMGYENDSTGVWIMGVGKKVCVLDNEIKLMWRD